MLSLIWRVLPWANSLFHTYLKLFTDCEALRLVTYLLGMVIVLSECDIGVADSYQSWPLARSHSDPWSRRHNDSLSFFDVILTGTYAFLYF